MRFAAVLGLAVVTGAVLACSSQFGERGDDIVPFPDPPAPRPTLGPTKSLAKAPPAISGGTLLVSNRLAIAADPDRDRLLLVDLDNGSTTTLALNPGDEPGRAVEDSAGRVHVVLRGGQGIATVDLKTQKLVSRRTICPAPRGIGYHAGSDTLYVACSGGELVSIAADGTVPTVRAELHKDLRDVVVTKANTLKISTFRSAEVLTVGLDGRLMRRMAVPPMPLFGLAGSARANSAYRTVLLPDGRLMMAHQRARDPNAAPISTAPGGYGGGGGGKDEGIDAGPDQPPCGVGIVQSAATFINEDFAQQMPPISMAVLPVDLAVDGATGNFAIVGAGNGHTPQLPQVFVLELKSMFAFGECARASVSIKPKGQAIAAAFSNGELVVQLREPAALERYDAAGRLKGTIALGGDSREDTGHAVFHSNAGSFLACASCHPEGSDDGHTWVFEGLGPRRTQNLRGGVTGTEPFHWEGDLKNLNALMGEVFAKRMSGGQLAEDQVKALAHFIDSIPYLPASPPRDAAKVARGKALFEDSKVACATCHSGPRTTNNASVDVGTGGVFQVPSLKGLAFRAPFMHTGCAPTVANRFATDCGGGDQHGKTSHLAPAQLDDLVAYLETL